MAHQDQEESYEMSVLDPRRPSPQPFRSPFEDPPLADEASSSSAQPLAQSPAPQQQPSESRGMRQWFSDFWLRQPQRRNTTIRWILFNTVSMPVALLVLLGYLNLNGFGKTGYVCYVLLFLAPIMLMTMGLTCWECHDLIETIRRKHNESRGDRALFADICANTLIWIVYLSTGLVIHGILRSGPDVQARELNARETKSQKTFDLIVFGVVPPCIFVAFQVVVRPVVHLTSWSIRRSERRRSGQ